VLLTTLKILGISTYDASLGDCHRISHSGNKKKKVLEDIKTETFKK